MPGRVRSRASASSRSSAARGCRRPWPRGRGCASGAGSMCIRSHSHEGIATDGRRRSAGATASARRPGPGARSPYRWTRRRNPANASWPVTFCSMIAGTSASKSAVAGAEADVRAAPMGLGDERMEVGPEAGRGRRRRRASPGRGRAPSRRRRPQASAWTSPSRRGGATRSVAGPTGVRMPRQTSSPSTRNVGSPPPWRCWPRMPWTGHGHAGRHTRSAAATEPTLTARAHTTPPGLVPACAGTVASARCPPQPTAAAAARPAVRPEKRQPPRKVPSSAL